MKLSEKQLEALAEFLPDCNLYYVELRKYCNGISEYHNTKAEGRDKLIWRVKIHGGSAYATYEDVEGAVHWLLSNDGQAALMDKIETQGTCAIDFSRSASGMKKEQTKNGEYVLWVHFCTISLSDEGGIMDYDSDRRETRQEALIAAVLEMLGVAE